MGGGVLAEAALLEIWFSLQFGPLIDTPPRLRRVLITGS